MNPCVTAKRIANSLHSQHLQVLRGVTLLTDAGAAVVFGNDDYAHDPETREEVRLILDRAVQDRVEVLGFETDDTGHSAWAMVLRSTDLDWLRARLREASYQSHCQNGAVRQAVRPEECGTSQPPVEADDAKTAELLTAVETIDENCVVEGEDRSF